MTVYPTDGSAISQGFWEGVIFAAINAGLEQGVFGRSMTDNGTMEQEAHDIWCGRYTFEHCGLPLKVRVTAFYGGAELSICAWLDDDGPKNYEEPSFGTRLTDGFKMIAHGWIEREKAFYLVEPRGLLGERFRARRLVRYRLCGAAVRVRDFFISPQVGAV